MPDLADAIDVLLPQTQCTKCGYAGCRPYAEAIAAGEAQINQCPPGGATGIAALAALTGHAIQPLNPANGVERAPRVARIDEAACIGCTKCIQACPVDAIIGSGKLMHAVIEAECNGCELCIPPCPVDCIAMVEVPQAPAYEVAGALARQYRRRYESRKTRLARDAHEHAEKMRARTEAALSVAPAALDPIAAALARAQARKAARNP